MKRNRPLLLALLTVGFVVGLTALVWHGPGEPRYHGKSLSAWLRAYTQPHRGDEAQQAADAVRHIGTNALPFLVSWIEDYQNPSPWRERLLRYVRKPGSPGREILMETIANREVRATRAFSAFEILGEAAAPAIPDLVRVANQGNPATSPLAIDALALLGKDALPALLALLANSAFPFRNEAMLSVGQMRSIDTNAHPAVVLLIQYLRDPRLSESAAEVLGRLGVESDITVPALAECTHSSNQDLRMAAASSLGKFGASARPAVPELLKMLDDSGVSIRSEARNALKQIAPEALRKTEPQ